MVFDTHLQWLKPMQKTGIGGNGSQFSLQTEIDRVAPDCSDRIDERRSVSSVSKCSETSEETLTRASNRLDLNGSPFPTGKRLLLPERLVRKQFCLIPPRLLATGEHEILDHVRVNLCHGMIWRKEGTEHQLQEMALARRDGVFLILKENSVFSRLTDSSRKLFRVLDSGHADFD